MTAQEIIEKAGGLSWETPQGIAKVEVSGLPEDRYLAVLAPDRDGEEEGWSLNERSWFGLFDALVVEAQKQGCEDMDLMLRAIAVGWKVVPRDLSEGVWSWESPIYRCSFAPRSPSSLRPEINDEIRALMKESLK